MNEETRQSLDRLIDAAHARGASIPSDNDPAMRAACELLEFEGELIVLFTDSFDAESPKARAAFFEGDIEPDRLEEIRAGSPLTEDEEERWLDHTEFLEETGEGVGVRRVAHSADPSRRAYGAWGERTGGQDVEITGWAGPVPSVEALEPFLAVRFQSWSGVFVDEMEGGAPYDPDHAWVMRKSEETRR